MIVTVLNIAALATSCVAGPMGVVVFGRWCIRQGETRIGLAETEAYIPEAEDVAATERSLPRFRGRAA